MATQYDSLVGRYLGISSSAFFHRLLLCSLLQFSLLPSLPFSFCITNRDPSSTSTLVLVFVPGRPPRGEERGEGGQPFCRRLQKKRNGRGKRRVGRSEKKGSCQGRSLAFASSVFFADSRLPLTLRIRTLYCFLWNIFRPGKSGVGRRKPLMIPSG